LKIDERGKNAKAEQAECYACSASLRGLLSLFLRSLYRASLSTSTAANALVSVDLVLAVYLADCFGGASLCTCAACNASIRNLVCHDMYLLF
jgi:hypothetical protein